MYVFAPNQIVETFPYSIGDLRKANPQTSFPANPSISLLASYGVYPVVVTGADFDPETQVATQSGCAFNLAEGQWETTWDIRYLTPEEIAERNTQRTAQAQEQRLQAYRDEADPLFFKWQRDEATKEDWINKVAEIKQRFPKPA